MVNDKKIMVRETLEEIKQLSDEAVKRLVKELTLPGGTADGAVDC